MKQTGIFISFLLLTFVVFISTPMLTSCKSDQSACDTLAIVKKYEETHPPVVTEKALPRSLSFKSRSGSAFSGPITDSAARAEHQNYLKGSLTLKDETNKIIHYLKINRDDLKTLYTEGKNGGMRLYFSQLTSVGVDYLSIIAVPIDENDDNIIKDKVTLINTLAPCPDQCVRNQPYRGTGSYNSVNDLNYDTTRKLWYKPNIDKDRWVDKDNNPKD